LEFTTLRNGIYDLVLAVEGGYQTAEQTVRFRLESDLKLGRFSYSEQDLVIPVNGIPLSVVRTYDSMNLDKGDFGYSWAYTLHDMDIQLYEDRSTQEDVDTGEQFSLRTGGTRDVTLTLPDGRRATFAFYWESGSCGFGLCLAPAWKSPPWFRGSLRAMGDNEYVPALNRWMADQNMAQEWYEFPSYILTMEDGTEFHIIKDKVGDFDVDTGVADLYSATPHGQPYLSEIVQRSGDKIEMIGFDKGVANPRIQYRNAQGNVTRSVVFQRDSQNRIIAISDPIAQLLGAQQQGGGGSPNNPQPSVKYEYDGSGNLSKVLKLVNRSTGSYTTNQYFYESGSFPHYLTKILDGRGVPVARNLYDDTGKLIGIINAAGKTNLFVYDLNAHSETVYDQMNNPTINVYDSRGNVTNTVDALGRHTSRTFDDDGNVTSMTDPMNHTYTYTYDSYGNPTSVVDPLGHTNLTAYNSNHQPTVMTNALGAVTRFQYDDRGNQTNTVDALNHSYGIVYDTNNKPTSITDPLGRVNATATYDSTGNLASLTDKFSGATTTFAYDANGNRTDSTNLWVNPTNSSDTRVVASHSVYDAQDRKISSTDPNGLQSSVTYDASGRQSQLLDEYNQTSGWVYDVRGSLIQISFPDNSISRMVHDDAGRMSVTDDKHLSGIIANGTRTTYDAVGQVIMSERLTNVVIDISTNGGIASSVVKSIGGVISTSTYGYDPAGRQIAMTNGFGSVTRYEYDEAGNQTAVIDALNHRTDNIYDEAGRLSITVNALMQITRYQYDALGRSVRTIYPDNSFTAVGYDAVGNRVTETNQLGLVTTYQYDSASRMTNILKPAVFDPETGSPVNPAWGFVYDANGQLQSVSNPKRRQTSFTYDQLGRPVTHTLPMGQTANRSYDSYGRTFRKVDFKGQTNEFLYDSTGRLGTNRFYAAGSGVATNAVTYAYDSEDRTKQIFEPHGMNAFTYDNQGHVLQIASPEGAVNYEYEPIEGRRIRTYTANSDLRYAYDELGRVKTVAVVKRDGVTLLPWEVTTNFYTSLGSLRDVYYPNGVHAAYQYDLVMNRLTNVVNYSSTGGILGRYQYTLGTNGVVKAVTETRLESNATYTTNQITYTYNNLGRLVREASVSPLSEANYTNNYVYDLAGNLLWRTNGATGEIITYSYNTNDQLLVESSSVSGSFTNKYDANGSLTNRASASESAVYAYDLQNRLTGANINRVEGTHNVAISASYTNNYMGLRVRSVAAESIDGAGATTQSKVFLFDTKSGSAQVLEELSVVGGAPTVSYTVGSKVLSQSKNGVVNHLLGDGHGSTRLLTDSSTAITARYSYDAYGKTLGFNPGIVNQPTTSVLYSGEQLDADLQQYYLRARYYNPSVGRFNQIDPFGPNQRSGMNLYAYVGMIPSTT